MVHAAWMGCGNSATPPSLCQSTGATASCLLSLVSLLLCSGASCLHASPSATSGLWFPASRAVWLSRSASAASTPSASRPSAIPSLKPWARSSAVCALHCAKKFKYSHSVYNMKCRIFLYTTRSVLASCLLPDPPPPLFITCCSRPSHPWADMPSVLFATRSSVTAAAGSMAPWQLWQSWRAQCSSLRELRVSVCPHLS